MHSLFWIILDRWHFSFHSLLKIMEPNITWNEESKHWI
jgi:hypothetical protein